MVTAVVAACAVLAACGLVLLAARRARIGSERRLEAILTRIDAHLEAMSGSVSRAVDSVVASGAERRLPVLTLDFDELLASLVAEAAARTGADAVVLRIEGPGGRPVVVSAGRGAEHETLDRSFGPPGAERFDAALIDWTYTAAGESSDERFRSALVTPLAPDAGVPGTLAAYARAADALGSEHVARVRDLLRDTAVGLANARRFAELESRVHIDPATGIANRRGYELELGREVARAHRTGRPLSVVVVGLANDAAGETGGTRGIGELARLVDHTTRRGDIACRRGERELAILLPGTAASGAAVLRRRLEDEARRRLTSGSSTITVGLVERRSAETSEALDERIAQALGRPRSAPVATLDDVRNASTAEASTFHRRLASGSEAARLAAGDALRRDALGAIARETVAAEQYGRSLALAILDVDGLDEIAESRDRETADAILSEIAGRIDRSLGAGSAHRLATTVFALVLPGSDIHEAEALVETLQSALRPPHHEPGVVLSAGITEVTEADDAEGALGRAEHALWQAAQAGSGTVVLAVPSRRAPR